MSSGLSLRERIAQIAAERAPVPQPDKPPMFFIRSGAFEPNGLHALISEASDCKMAPGEWPEQFETDHAIGNGQPFKLTKVRPDGSHVYWQVLGTVQIVILND
jgi:hypothetical protein